MITTSTKTALYWCKIALVIGFVIFIIVFLQLGSIHRRLDTIDNHLPRLLSIEDYVETSQNMMDEKLKEFRGTSTGS